MTAAPKDYFVSDLHLFSRRSLGDRHVPAVRAAAARAERFVLGGDIFDFRWSTIGSTENTVAAAIDWLRDLAASHSRCDFHFVLGNHDSNARFVAALERLCRELPNLNWHRYFLRLDRRMFLHGDIVDRKMNQQMLHAYRRQFEDDEQRGEMPNLLYDLAVQARLHRLTAALIHRRRRVARRLSTYLAEIGHGPNNGLRHVYFGHTHVPMADYEFGGLFFHNGGAPIKGLKFRIVETHS